MALVLLLQYKNLLNCEVKKIAFFPVHSLNLSTAFKKRVKNKHPAWTLKCTAEGSRGQSHPSRCRTEGTSDNVLSRVMEGVSAQGGELVPVPQEAPIVLAWVHNEPAEEPAPRLLSKGLLDFPLSHIITDVYQLDQEDVGHAGCDDHRVPHAGEGQGGAVICIHSRTIEESCEDTSFSTNGVQGQRDPIHRGEQEDRKGKYECLMI